MTTTSFGMNRYSIASFLMASFVSLMLLYSCKKSSEPSKDTNAPVSITPHQASAYSSDVLDKWMSMQLRLMRKATGIPNQAFSRHMVYSGITALESLAPGLTPNNKWLGTWNGLTGLPAAENGAKFYYPA